MVRCETGKKRNVYFVSTALKKLVQLNEKRFKFINLGVKLLSRSISQHVDCEFRLVQDGLHILYPYITKRIVRFTKDDVVTLLSSENPFISKMSTTTQAQMQNLGQGGCVFVYEPHDNMDGPKCRLLLCGWMGKVSCRSFLPKNDRAHFLRLCGAELKEYPAERKDKDETCDFEIDMTAEGACDEDDDNTNEDVTCSDDTNVNATPDDMKMDSEVPSVKVALSVKAEVKTEDFISLETKTIDSVQTSLEVMSEANN
jgi:tRNA (cytosine34-C5)-methyltransferase